ncbi:MAG: peptide chain release factor 2 [Phycisphaerales bacterium]|nr:peptide chain release factor 2 [Phycisphaerales bacterium]
MEGADFWNNQQVANRVVMDLKLVASQIDPIDEFVAKLDEAKTAFDMAREAGPPGQPDKDFLSEADTILARLSEKIDALELRSLMSGKHDYRNAYLTISAGDGGTEANDWAEMLFRMYLNYLERAGFGIEEVERGFGSEVGIDSVTLHVKGPYAFGFLKCERGTHRLARVSPFNAQGKRQTSFATVEVTPELDDVKVEIPDRDLEIVPFVRASGPGGQNVNKVATAIRMTHKPTGITVVANTFRDQPQNRAQCLRLITARLEQMADEKREREINAAKGGSMDTGWGAQIRSYVIYDSRVKDHRTDHEDRDVDKVLAGHIQPFIDAELKRRRKEEADRAMAKE